MLMNILTNDDYWPSIASTYMNLQGRKIGLENKMKFWLTGINMELFFTESPLAFTRTVSQQSTLQQIHLLNKGNYRFSEFNYYELIYIDYFISFYEVRQNGHPFWKLNYFPLENMKGISFLFPLKLEEIYLWEDPFKVTLKGELKGLYRRTN